MDPAHDATPLSHLERMEDILLQHKAMTAAAAEAKQAAEAHDQALATLSGQQQQLAIMLTQAP